MTDWGIQFGSPYPYGATWNESAKGFNFALYSKHATRVRLLLFDKEEPFHAVLEYELDPAINKTGTVWHCFLDKDKLQNANSYAYRVDGPNEPGCYFRFQKLLLDPWARAVYFPPAFSREASLDDSDNLGMAVLGQLFKKEDTDEDLIYSTKKPKHNHDLIIYELHVKGFTNHHSSGVTEKNRGTFSGIIEKIPYLKELGITAVELMPVHQFDIREKNYWGYMTLNFFAPHNRYCTSKIAAAQITEFKKLVKALHDADIEVILDVIYNHTSEGGHGGPVFSYKGIDNSSYYLLSKSLQYYDNDAGSGNVFRTAHKIVRQLILDSLRYWVQEMGVDGFRFDLASIFTRNDDGTVNLDNPPILEEISIDPVLSKVRLIAEPWDLESYQLGLRFPGKSWRQWNGDFRDDIRRFIKADNGMLAAAMLRIYGSDDLFPDEMPFSGHPFQSINFITAHDGFTLYDLVAYNVKHNQANGENNNDGSDDNYSWNCGVEGDNNLPTEVMNLRERQAKNLMCLLMLSNGVPMMQMGDEFLRTQMGNNNAYNQDNEISWLDWERRNTFSAYFRFVKLLIAFRKKHPSICRSSFWKADVKWFGVNGEVDYSFTSHSFAFYLDGKKLGDSDLYVIVNTYWEPLNFKIQVGNPGQWNCVIDTALESPQDFEESGRLVMSENYNVQARSVVVLERSSLV